MIQIPKLRSVNYFMCRSGYGVALGEFLAMTGKPSIGFITCQEKSIFIGRQLRTTKVNIQKARADGITIRRQNCRGKITMMSDCNELTITIGISDFQRYGYKAKELYKYFCRVINIGSVNLGIGSEASEVNRSPSIFANDDCYKFVAKGDMCSVTSGKKFSAGTFIIYNNYFQLDMVINLTNKSNVAPYLETPEDGFDVTSIEQETGKPVNYSEVIGAYKKAFQDTIGLEEKSLSFNETLQLQKLAKEKYLTDDWIYKKWRE